MPLTLDSASNSHPTSARRHRFALPSASPPGAAPGAPRGADPVSVHARLAPPVLVSLSPPPRASGGPPPGSPGRGSGVRGRLSLSLSLSRRPGSVFFYLVTVAQSQRVQGKRVVSLGARCRAPCSCCAIRHRTRRLL